VSQTAKKSLRKIQKFNLDQPTQDHGRVSQLLLVCQLHPQKIADVVS
jgi:hypothetical protein